MKKANTKKHEGGDDIAKEEINGTKKVTKTKRINKIN